uniref:protein-tyrosine-phosphatase n=1 Tax=Klebsiella pneumoniae TaxID=573 RepID=A0A088MS38_KLEPN|nr:Wzb [Klebsiella pneumoniae]
MFSTILIVCTGNICRSPIGERYLQQLLPSKNISSAGTQALVDHEADQSADEVARKNGISLAGHLGRQFTSKLSKEYELILVMEKNHIEHISNIAPES